MGDVLPEAEDDARRHQGREERDGPVPDDVRRAANARHARRGRAGRRHGARRRGRSCSRGASGTAGAARAGHAGHGRRHAGRAGHDPRHDERHDAADDVLGHGSQPARLWDLYAAISADAGRHAAGAAAAAGLPRSGHGLRRCGSRTESG